MTEPKRTEGSRGLYVNPRERVCVLSAFAVKAAVSGDKREMAHHIEALKDGEKDKLINACLLVVQHTSVLLSLNRMEAQIETKTQQSDIDRLIGMVDECNATLKKFGVDMEASNRERS